MHDQQRFYNFSRAGNSGDRRSTDSRHNCMFLLFPLEQIQVHKPQRFYNFPRAGNSGGSTQHFCTDSRLGMAIITKPGFGRCPDHVISNTGLLAGMSVSAIHSKRQD